MFEREAAMANPGINSGMQVLTSDGEVLGTVERASTDGFLLRRMTGQDSEKIPELWIHRVDDHVHLNRTGAEALAGWKSLQFQTSAGEKPGAPVEETSAARGGNRSWLLWIALALVILIAAFLLLPRLTA
jgi:hypothetical protein